MTATATDFAWRTLPRRRSGLELSNAHGLVALYLLNDWLRAKRNGNMSLGPGVEWFARQGLLTGLLSENRGVALRLARRTVCLQCEQALSPDSTGDHIVSLEAGGPAGVANYLPLCGACNSSKGAQDLLAWWIGKKHRSTLGLPHEALVAYIRLTLALYLRTRRHRKVIEGPLEHGVCELLDELPKPEPLKPDRREAMWHRVQAFVGGP